MANTSIFQSFRPLAHVILLMVMTVAVIGCSESSTGLEGFWFVRPAGHTHNISKMENSDGNVDAIINDQSILIENGGLAINGEDCGTVEKGDRIVIYNDGSIKINGTLRYPIQ